MMNDPVSLASREEFTRFEEVIFSDLDGSKTKEMIRNLELHAKAWKHGQTDADKDLVKRGSDAVMNAVSILKGVWERAHNRNLD